LVAASWPCARTRHRPTPHKRAPPTAGNKPHTWQLWPIAGNCSSFRCRARASPGRPGSSGKHGWKDRAASYSGGSKPYKIVAAASGTIIAIEDGFSEQQDSDTATQCNNNYVWIEHPNGEWTKYSHMTKGSTTGKAGLKVGDKVKAGQYPGDEGAVGCAGGVHLHFEGARVAATDPITTVGGFVTDNAGSKRNRITRICGIPGGVCDGGETYTARAVPDMLAPGAKEVVRHGLPIRDYQCLFDQAVAANYEPVWLDLYDAGGDAYVNAIFRPRTGGSFQAYHGLTGAQYQEKFDTWTKQGYRPVIVESYLDSGVRYAVVFKKANGPAYSAYHGLTAEQHQAKMDSLTAQGYRPVALSVVSSGGRKYTGLYLKTDVGSWQAKSKLTPAQYQTLYDENALAGRRVAYLNAYNHDGEPYLVAIWTSKTPAGGKQRHGLTGAQYQAEWSSAIDGGMLTRGVTGYDAAGSARFAASWRP
jgi:murein DD-endopeptidase MepM/ murein hydrolase activator NlpD